MRRLTFCLLLFLIIALPAHADFGLSNTVEKEIHRPAADATAVTPSAACPKEEFYPYTIHLSSWPDPRSAMDQIEKQEKSVGPLFMTKIDLGNSGIWYRVDFGAFPSIKEAVMKLRELQKKRIIDKGAFVGRAAPYTLQLGQYPKADTATGQVRTLRRQGIMAYVISETPTCHRLLVGAYPDMESARLMHDDLRALGLSPSVTKR